MKPQFRILLYLAGLAWAGWSGLLPALLLQLGALGAAAVFLSAAIERRGAPLIGAWIETVWLGGLVWCMPGQSEIVWIAIGPVSLASATSPRDGFRLGVGFASFVVVTAGWALGRAALTPVLMASVVFLPVAALFMGRKQLVAPVIVDAPQGELEELRQSESVAREGERTARRAYRELVALYRQLKANHDGQQISFRFAEAVMEAERPLDRLLEIAVDISGALGGSIWLAEDENRRIVIRSLAGNHGVVPDEISLADAQLAARQIEEVGAGAAKALLSGPRMSEEFLLRDGDRVIGLLTLRPRKRGDELRRGRDLALQLVKPLRYLLSQETLGRKLELAEAKIRATELISSSEGAAAVSGRAVELMKRFVEAEHWSVYLLGKDGLPQRVLERGRDLDLLSALGIGGGAFSGWLRQDAPLMSADAFSDGTLSAEWATRLRMRSILCLPLSTGGVAVGAILLADPVADRFDASSRALLMRLAPSIAHALHLASVRDKPLAVVRLDAATGLLSYREFADRLSESLNKGKEVAVARFVAGNASAEEMNGFGGAIAEAIDSHGFGAKCGDRELVACFESMSVEQAQAVATLIAARFASLRVGHTVVAGRTGMGRHELLDALSGHVRQESILVNSLDSVKSGTSD